MINQPSEMKRTARIAGLSYLALAITGVLGFMVFHSQVYVTNDPAKTLENLIEHESIARTRLLFEFAIIVSQAFAAVWFYRLFKHISEGSAWTLGVWGMMNSAIILVSAIAMAAAISIASSTIQADDKVILIQLLEQLSTNAWGVGGLFFGLWLIPMGYIVVSSKRMPVLLGWILIIGGIGYLLSTALKYAGFVNPVVDSLPLAATVGEFWMIAYLLIYGIRPSEVLHHESTGDGKVTASAHY